MLLNISNHLCSLDEFLMKKSEGIKDRGIFIRFILKKSSNDYLLILIIIDYFCISNHLGRSLGKFEIGNIHWIHHSTS